jgi:hypothetical protein
VLVLPEHAAAIATSQIRRISELQQHRNALTWVIDTAEQHLVIAAPFISMRAIPANELAERIAAAKSRRPALRVTMYTDACLSTS